MKARRSVLMVLALAGAFTFFGAMTAMAQLNFSSLQGTWWVATKLMDKGYVFTMPPADGVNDKAKKRTWKTKEGYIYIPDDSLDVNVFERVTSIAANYNGGYDVVHDHNLEMKGGNPYDFVVVAEAAEDDLGRMLVIHTTLKEDKKDLGQIKSGKMSTIGGSFYMPLDDGIMFAGNHDYKWKWIPEDKVPDHIKLIVFPE